MNITIDVDDYKLNVRAAGVMIHNGKILVHRNVNSDHYALIGGRVEIGESSANTIKREIKEELWKDIEITGYISIIENFFEMKGSKYHEIMFVHKIEFINEEDKKIEYIMKNVEGKDYLQYEWIDLDKIEEYPLVPKAIKDVLKESIRCSLKILDLADKEITIPLLALVYLSPLRSIFLKSNIPLGFVTWLVGESGSQKSSISALLASHFGDFERDTLPEASKIRQIV